MATVASRPAEARRFSHPDTVFTWGLRTVALVPVALIVILGLELFHSSEASRHQFGWGFLTGSRWDAVSNHFGAWPFIFGTLVTTAIAVLLAAPLGVGTAVFLTEVAPGWLRRPVGYLVDLSAAIPSVVYGLWGIFVVAPWLQRALEPWLGDHFGWLPLFQGAPYGLGFLAAGLVLAMMVTPFVVSLAREAIGTVPRAQSEAAYALGSTHWEVVSHVVIPGARSGIWGGVMLAMGRALGETMAVTMLIGNTHRVSMSLFAPGDTLSSVIANEFTEATGKLYTSALIEIGLVLFGITLIVNLFGRMLIGRLARAGTGAV